MSRYGSVAITGPTSLITRVVESADPDDLQARVLAALAALPVGYVVIDVTLAGSGFGQLFTVTIAAGATADVTGGFAAPPDVNCFLASDADALAIASGVALPTTGTVSDLQVAGASNGNRFMGMYVNGELAPDGGGGTLLQFGTSYTAAGNLDPTGSFIPVPGVGGDVILTFTDWTADDVLDGEVSFEIASTQVGSINLVARVEVSLDSGATWQYIDGGSGPPASCAFNIGTVGGAAETFSAGTLFSVALPSAPIVRLTYINQADLVTTNPATNALRCRRLSGSGLVQPLTSLLQPV